MTSRCFSDGVACRGHAAPFPFHTKPIHGHSCQTSRFSNCALPTPPVLCDWSGQTDITCISTEALWWCSKALLNSTVVNSVHFIINNFIPLKYAWVTIKQLEWLWSGTSSVKLSCKSTQVKALHRYRQTLKKVQASRSSPDRLLSYIQFSQDLQIWRAEGAKICTAIGWTRGP